MHLITFTYSAVIIYIVLLRVFICEYLYIYQYSTITRIHIVHFLFYCNMLFYPNAPLFIITVNLLCLI